MRGNLFYIQDSRSYVGNDALWWGKNNAEYVTDLDKAEVYTREEAIDICKNRDTDIPWPFDYINSISRRAVDMQYLNIKKKLKVEVNSNG
jgi:hypothetical protein